MVLLLNLFDNVENSFNGFPILALRLSDISDIENETSGNREVNYDSDESSEKISEISIEEEDYEDEKIIIKKSKNKNKLNVNI